MKKILLGLVMSIALIGTSYAGSFGVGVQGSLAHVQADGKETTSAGTNGTANTNNASTDALAGIASIFADYEFDNGIILGLEYVPGAADVSDKTHSRTETAQGVSGTDASGSVTRTADAEIENFNTLYIEYPIDNMFVKLGYAQLDVNTKENAITSSGTYGNATLDGYSLGAGVNGSIGDYFTKTSVEYTDFEDLKLTSTTSNTIKADLDVLEFKFAVGKRF